MSGENFWTTADERHQEIARKFYENITFRILTGQAWLYNTQNESTEWLTYDGEPQDLSR